MSDDSILDAYGRPAGEEFAFNMIAAQWGTRFQDWSFISSVPLAEWAALPQWERNTIIARLRWLVENNEYAAALTRAFVAHIGNSTLRSKSKDKGYNAAKEQVWLDWSDECEVSGMALEEVEDLISKELLCAGECFLRKVAKTGKVQLVKSEWVFSDTDAPENEIQGIAYNEDGAPTGYRFAYREKGSKTLRAGKSLTPASQVIHIYQRSGVELLRGVPWLAASVLTFKDVSEITSAKVGAVKLQAFAATAITKNGAPGHPFTVNGAENGSGANGDQAANKVPARFKTIRPNGVYYLQPGEEMKMLTPAFQSQDFDTFLVSRLRAASSVLGMPIECWLSGFGESNYSSSRSTAVTWGIRVKKVRSLMERRFLKPAQRWVADRARAARQLKGDRILDKETFFGWPALIAIDPNKDAEGNIKRLEAGLTTYSAIYAEQNLWFEDEIRQRARDLRLIKEAAKAEDLDPAELIAAMKSANPMSPVSPAPAAPPPAAPTEPEPGARGDISPTEEAA